MPTPTASGLLLDSTSPSRANVCITVSKEDKPNYALSNFYDNEGKGYWFKDPVLTSPIWFPTAEHYLHFQKLTPTTKQAIVGNLAVLNAWKKARPSEILAAFKSKDPDLKLREKLGAKEVSAFVYGPSRSWTQWNQAKVMVQMQINAIKYQQSKAFRDSIQMAINMGNTLNDGQGPVSIIQDTASATTPEIKWGSGVDGEGKNILGNTQAAYAKMVQTATSPPTPFDPSQTTIPLATSLATIDPATAAAAYTAAETQYKTRVKPTLTKLRANMQDKKKDTSEASSVKPIDATLSRTTPNPTSSAALRLGDVSFIVEEFRKKFPLGSGGSVETKDQRTILTFPAEDKKSADDVAADFFAELAKQGKPFLTQKYLSDKPQDKYHFFSGKGDLLSGTKKEIEDKLTIAGDTEILRQFQEATKPKGASEYRQQMDSGRPQSEPAAGSPPQDPPIQPQSPT